MSGLWTRSLTIQFLVVILVEIFTVYTQDRVLQRLVKQIIVFQQRLPSKSLTFQFCVVRLTIFVKILFLQLVLPICPIRQIKCFFALFPVGKKCGGCRAGQCAPALARQLMDSGGLCAAQWVSRGGGRAARSTDTARDTSAVGLASGAHRRLVSGEEEEEEEEEVEETSSWFLIFTLV